MLVRPRFIHRQTPSVGLRSGAYDGSRTTVRKLSDEERREEIARMLSGASITDEARAQASRLLDAA